MKFLSEGVVLQLATKYNAEYYSKPLPTLDLGGYGFEATENDNLGMYGWRYFGDLENQDLVIDLWNDLTVVSINKPLLTIEAANELLNKKVRLSYCDDNEGEMILLIYAIVEEPSSNIGQSTSKKIHYYIIENGVVQPELKRNGIYEWQGIFRRGSGAERLFIEQVYQE
uniref:hypothetical protein n=1 Tax=Pedobacter schmidteae TaxID=2201271 RepID=UPI000EB2A8F9|nr:hypothetical protein [Pedobacter schmidteae]